MTSGRALACAATLCALLSSCSSTSLVACKTEADCAPYAGTVCFQGYCRKPSMISGDVDFSASSEDMAPDLSLFCGDGGLTSCPASTPVCDDNECRGCTSADDSLCAARIILTPACDTTTGACAACSSNADCPDATNNTCSFDGSCRPGCSTNADCASGICDYGTFNGTSVCARADEIVHVSGGCGATPDGSAANPYCTFDGAITKLSTGGFISVDQSSKIVAPGTMPFAHSYVVFAQGSSTSFGFSPPPPNTIVVHTNGLQIANGGNLFVYGLSMENLATGIVCSSGKLTLKHTQIATSSKGIDATDCVLDIDSTWLSQNGTGAALHGASALHMTNSIVSESSTVGISLDGSASMSLGFDTIANNTNSAGTVGAFADSSSGVSSVSNSIVFGNTQVNNQSWSGTVDFTNCDADSPSAATYATAPKWQPLLNGVNSIANSYHLVAGAANNVTCCFDKASTGPNQDYDGQARPLGAGYDIGADEVQ